MELTKDNLKEWMAARLKEQNRNETKPQGKSMLSLMTRQLGGDAVARSMAREILNESPWEVEDSGK